jgi:membrane-associated phospholipid phosphatase
MGADSASTPSARRSADVATPDVAAAPVHAPSRGLLPRGWKDFALQLALFMVVNIIYEVTRGLSDGDIVSAFGHARDLVSAERTLGIFSELDVQRFALDHHWALTVANLTYFHAHFAVTVAFLLWAYLRRNEHYTFLRNVVFVSDAIALVGYIAFPTAPPRMLSDLGFIDTLERFASVNHGSGLIAELANPFAAVPSVHTCYATIFATAGVLLVRRRPFKVAWALYPVLIVFSIVATGNHFYLDAVAGFTVAVTALAIARAIERSRPSLPASARRRLRLPAGAPDGRLAGGAAAHAR